MIPEDNSEQAVAVRKLAFATRKNSSVGNPKKETSMVTTYAMNNYLDLHYSRMAELWNEPGDYFRELMHSETKPGKMQLFSLLSLFFRNDGNASASEKFLQ